MLIKILLLVAGLIVSNVSYAELYNKTPKMHGAGHVMDGKRKACHDIAMRCASKVSSVVDNHGRIWSVWAIKQHLYLNYSDDLGQHFSTPKKVNTIAETISTRGENRPKIAIDSNANVYLSWVTPLKKRFTSNVRFSYWSYKLQQFTPPVTVNNDGLLTGHSFNELVVSPQGDVFISWLDGRAKIAAAKKGIRLRTSELYLAKANFVSGDTRFDNQYLAQGTCVCCRLAMNLDQRNLPMMMWRHVFGDNVRDHALISMINEKQTRQIQRVSFENWQIDGCPHQGPSMLISDNTYSSDKTPSNDNAPSSHSASRIHMSWFNNAADASGLFYSYSDNQGQTMAKVNHFAPISDSPEHPFLSQNTRQQIQLVWREFDGQQYHIKYMASNDGDKLSVPKMIAQSAGNVDYPSILQHGINSYLHWHRQGQPLTLIKLP